MSHVRMVDNVTWQMVISVVFVQMVQGEHFVKVNIQNSFILPGINIDKLIYMYNLIKID